MAEVHVVSDAVSELLSRSKAPDAVWMVRGEFFLHQAHALDLVADSSGDAADRLRAEAQLYRERGRIILGPVGS